MIKFVYCDNFGHSYLNIKTDTEYSHTKNPESSLCYCCPSVYIKEVDKILQMPFN